MSFDFPDEELMAVLQIEEEESPKEDGWKMYFDEASNALGRDVGAVLISPIGNHCPFTTMWQNTRHVCWVSNYHRKED